MRRLILMMLVLCCCSEQQKPVRVQKTFVYQIEPALEYYVEDFFSEAAKRNVFLKKENLIVAFADSLGNKTIGLSSPLEGQRRVFIKRKFFEVHKKEYYRIENVIFHELGHAMLNRKHNNHYSIMNTHGPSDIYATSVRERRLLLHELFLGDKVNIFVVDEILPQ